MLKSTLAFVASIAFVTMGCGSGLSSDEEAEQAYLGLDASLDRAIQLGFDGFNAASSANIPAQTGNGAKSGTMVISGKVDQGASANKTMDLTEELKGYSDNGKITYDTPYSLPLLSMKLSNIPNGTVTGTLSGTYAMTGDVEGDVTLSLSFTGDLQPTAADPSKIERVPGSSHVTGTATTADDAVFDIDVTH